MNTLDDLRATLTHEADRLGDPDRYARPVAVRGRIRAVRRRRRATAGAVAAALVVATAAGVTALHRPDRVEPAAEVAGVRVPRHVTVTGFPYRLSGTAALEGAGDNRRMHLGAGPERVVSLVADGLGSGSATLYADGEPVARAHGDHDVELPTPVGTFATTLRVRLDDAPRAARVGLAVYDTTGALAPGVSNGHAVFRTTVAGDRLLAGAFSDPGAGEVTVRFTGALSDVRFSDYCSTATGGLWYGLTLDGRDLGSGDCVGNDPRDAGTSSSVYSGRRVREHVLRATFTRGSKGPRVSPPDGVLGLGVYRLAAAGRDVLGLDVSRTLEQFGRTWQLERVIPQPAGSRGRLSTTIATGDSDRLVGLVGRGATVGLVWKGRLTDGTSAYLGARTGTASTTDSLLLSGDRYRVTVDSTGGSPFDGAILVYRPV